MAFLKKVYGFSPAWVQNVMVSTQGLFYARRRWDVALGRKLLGRLRESQWWSDEKFREYQNKRLQDHIQYAVKFIPYYGELFKQEGIDPATIRSVEGLTSSSVGSVMLEFST